MPENKLLASLPGEVRERLGPYLKPVRLEFEEVLVEFDQPIEHVYFLENAVTSTVVRTPHGETIEVGLMGAEGFVGLSLLYGVERSNGTVVVQIAGDALRMRAADFIRHVTEPGGPLLKRLLRYANFFAVMVQQHAACNAAHLIEARMCRWILLTHDRVRGDEFPLTHEYLSRMLGVRRPTVSDIAHKLKAEGLVDYKRGQIRILDPEGLVAGSCECYGLMEREMDRIFAAPWREDGQGG